MEITGYVFEDSENVWKDKDGKEVRSRMLVMIDQSKGETRLQHQLKLTLQDSEDAGEIGSLRDTVIRVGILRISQNEFSKQVAVMGRLLARVGTLTLEPMKKGAGAATAAA